MEYAPFRKLFPKVAKRDTRTLVIKKSNKILPPGKYIFLESYCTALDDCKRVFLNVYYNGSNKEITGKILAVIGFGWEDIEYYEKDWAGLIKDGIVTAEQMKGPNLERGQPQSKYAENLLLLSRKYLFNDAAYIDRLARHSEMFDKKLKQMDFKPGYL